MDACKGIFRYVHMFGHLRNLCVVGVFFVCCGCVSYRSGHSRWTTSFHLMHTGKLRQASRCRTVKTISRWQGPYQVQRREDHSGWVQDTSIESRSVHHISNSQYSTELIVAAQTGNKRLIQQLLQMKTISSSLDFRDGDVSIHNVVNATIMTWSKQIIGVVRVVTCCR